MGTIFIGGSLVLQYYKMIDGMTLTIVLGVGIGLILNTLRIGMCVCVYVLVPFYHILCYR